MATNQTTNPETQARRMIRAAFGEACGIHARHEDLGIRFRFTTPDGALISFNTISTSNEAAWTAFLAVKIRPLLRRKLAWILAKPATPSNLEAARVMVQRIERGDGSLIVPDDERAPRLAQALAMFPLADAPLANIG